MWNFQKLATGLLLVLAYLSIAQGIWLTEVKPKQISLEEGEDVKLHCAANQNYEWCNFIHHVIWEEYQSCSFQMNRATWNVTTVHCDDFNGRIEFNYKTRVQDLFICEITLKSVTLEDQGIWNCLLTSVSTQTTNKTQGEMRLEVHPKNQEFWVKKFDESIYAVEQEDLEVECNIVKNSSSEIGEKYDYVTFNKVQRL